MPSGVSLETAAIFLLLPNVAKFLERKSCQLWRLNLFYFWLSTMVSSKFEGESFQRIQTVKMIYINNGTIPKGYNSYINNCTFISLIYTFPWREK